MQELSESQKHASEAEDSPWSSSFCSVENAEEQLYIQSQWRCSVVDMGELGAEDHFPISPFFYGPTEVTCI